MDAKTLKNKIEEAQHEAAVKTFEKEKSNIKSRFARQILDISQLAYRGIESHIIEEVTRCIEKLAFEDLEKLEQFADYLVRKRAEYKTIKRPGLVHFKKFYETDLGDICNLGLAQIKPSAKKTGAYTAVKESLYEEIDKAIGNRESVAVSELESIGKRFEPKFAEFDVKIRRVINLYMVNKNYRLADSKHYYTK